MCALRAWSVRTHGSGRAMARPRPAESWLAELPRPPVEQTFTRDGRLYCDTLCDVRTGAGTTGMSGPQTPPCTRHTHRVSSHSHPRPTERSAHITTPLVRLHVRIRRGRPACWTTAEDTPGGGFSYSMTCPNPTSLPLVGFFRLRAVGDSVQVSPFCAGQVQPA